MTTNARMAEFIKTHKMPDHTEQYAEEMLGAKPAEVLPDPDRIIPVDDEHKLIDESVKAAKMVEIKSSPKEEKHMDESFPKYQYSKFLGPNREEQLVIRADTWEEFIELKRNANEIIEKVSNRIQEAAPAGAVNPQYAPVQPVQPAADVPYCKIHGTPMKWKQGISKKNGKAYAFWSCSMKFPDGRYCDYKPE